MNQSRAPGEKFYSIEYFIDGIMDIAHAFLTDEKLHELAQLLNSKGVSYEIHCLTRPNTPGASFDESMINVDSSNDIIVGLSDRCDYRRPEPTE